MTRPVRKEAASGRRRWRIVCAVLVTGMAAAVPSSAAAQPSAAEGREMLVPGGTAALLRAAGVRVPVERDRAMLVLIRRLHAGRTRPDETGAVAARSAADASDPERIPGLLPLDVWQQAAFGGKVPAGEFAVSILQDRRASFLYYGLFALDPDTLDFFAGSPALLGQVLERSAPAFAAYSEGIRIRDGRVEVAGGADAERAWAAALGAAPAEPIHFVPALLERNEGRLAQLFGALGRLDAPHLAFSLGPSARDLPGLIAAAAAFDARVQLPFRSWSDVDVPFLLERVAVTADGRMAPPRDRAFWEAALAGEVTLPVRTGPPEEVTAAWLVDRFGALPPTLRRDRLDALLFAQRLAARSGGEASDRWLEPASTFPRWQTLFLTLEQMGAVDPQDYLAGARSAAAAASGYGATEASRRLAILQAALALVARLARVGTLAPPDALNLARELFRRAGSDRLGYASGFVDWMEQSLGARLPTAAPGTGLEARLLDALAGPAAGAATPTLEWEGHRYALDVARAERQRLEAVREGQGGATLDDVSALRRDLARPSSGSTVGQVPASGDAHAPRRLAADLEATLADIMVALVYALSTDPDAPSVPGDGPWRRHDFGLGSAASGPWRLADLKAGRGATGSLLGLDRVLARQALRPTMVGLPPRPPTLTLEDTTGFAESVAALDPLRLTDEGRDLIAAALRRGRSRLAGAAARPPELDALLASAGVDGTRRRLARLAAPGGLARVVDYVSLCEVLEIGQDGGAAIHGDVLKQWGVAARLVDGSLGQWMPGPLAWRERAGRRGSGVLSAYVADLQLHVADWLAERQLPSPLAQAVLSFAMWDLTMTAQAADADDWLAVVRAAQAVSSERLEDYVAGLTAGGPLFPIAAAAQQE